MLSAAPDSYPLMDKRSPLTVGAWALAMALIVALGGGATAFAVHRASARKAAEAADAERTRAAAEQEARRRRELEGGIEHFARVKAELRAFGEWLRAVRPRVLAGQASAALGDVKCTGPERRRGPTCSASHSPHGGTQGIRYQIRWYRDHPEDMRATASGVPYSPLVNCETLGLRQKTRRAEGHTTILYCGVPDSRESYVIGHTASAGSQKTTVVWSSSEASSQDEADSQSG